MAVRQYVDENMGALGELEVRRVDFDEKMKLEEFIWGEGITVESVLESSNAPAGQKVTYYSVYPVATGRIAYGRDGQEFILTVWRGEDGEWQVSSQ